MQHIIDIRKKCVPIKEALEKYPPLRAFETEKGLDLGDTIALRIYNIAIAKIMLDLDISVPDTYLIPTICLRYFYVRTVIERFNPSTIVEIGTGASAILSMIAAKIYDKQVIATELNEQSFQSAEENIRKNNLQDKILLKKSNGQIIAGILTDEMDMLLCYPPVYPDVDSINFEGENRNFRGFQGSIDEMIGGGDDGFSFTRTLIMEAIDARIKILTILIINKKHVDMAQEILKEYETEVITIIAGIRERYILVGYLAQSK